MRLSVKDAVSLLVALASVLTALEQYRGKEQQTQRADEHGDAAVLIAEIYAPALAKCMAEKGQK